MKIQKNFKISFLLNSFEVKYQIFEFTLKKIWSHRNVNINALDKLEQEGLAIYPKPKDLRIIQNKATQKQFYTDNNIPTAPFTRFENLNDLKESIKNNVTEFPFVWKSARFGYDGTGVKMVRSANDLQSLPNGLLKPCLHHISCFP